MFKTLLKFLTVCTLAITSTQTYADTQALPDTFYVKERWLSWTTTFDIETKEKKLGTVHRKLISLTPEYHLKDFNGDLMAKARMRFWSFGAAFDITDQNANPIGSVEEKFSFFPSFYILSAQGHRLAEAKLNFWGTKYTIVDPATKHTIATLYRPFFQFKNNWTVTIVDPIAIGERHIHPHTFLTLMAFQVDREYWESTNLSFQGKALDPIRTLCANTDLFKSKLETYRESLSDIEPSQEDFLTIEALTHVDTFIGEESSEECIEHTLCQLFDYFEREDLTNEQKAALFLMLEDRLTEDTKEQ